MNRTVRLSLCAVLGTMAALLVTGCGGSDPVAQATSNLDSGRAVQGKGIQLANPAANMSGRVQDNVFVPDSTRPQGNGFMSTNHVFLNGRSKAQPMAFSGWSPAQLRACYGITGGGSGTIVIVDAFDDPTALADFNQYSAQYGLPQETSTNVTASTNQHFQIVYAQNKKPRYNQGWSQEESLDIELAHAMAPNAKIVLIECSTNANTYLYAGDDLAPSYGKQCSNSWSGPESSGEASSDTHFNHPGTVYFFSGGDTGGVKGYPSTSPFVVSVGGTNLSLNADGSRATETAWTDSGCGISSYESIPSFQSGLSDGVHRGDDDISAVGDPNTGVSIRWNGGWYIAGGTSVSCPMIAAMVNTAGTNRTGGAAQNLAIYAARGTSALYDVVSGTAGTFSAHAGWDYPTGCGTPNGTGAF